MPVAERILLNRGHAYKKKSKKGWNVCSICNIEFAKRSEAKMKQAALAAAKKTIP